MLKNICKNRKNVKKVMVATKTVKKRKVLINTFCQLQKMVMGKEVRFLILESPIEEERGLLELLIQKEMETLHLIWSFLIQIK